MPLFNVIWEALPLITMLVLLGMCILLWICRKKQAAIHQLSYTDPVTGGGNLDWFLKEAKKLIADNPQTHYAVITINIDDFKIINDSFSREAGDKTLAYVYQSIRRYINNGELVVRTSADNFLLLLEDCSEEEMITRLYDITMLVNDFNYQEKNKYFVLLTAGICSIEDSENLDLLRIQDHAQFAYKNAKQMPSSGLFRSCYFRPEDRSTILREKRLENRLEHALSNNDLLVYLQPKYELVNNTIAGAEALVRWHDPELGMIPPSQFIYLFERNGFIVPLDLFVFRGVCKTLRKWLDLGIQPIPISVNLSRLHLYNPDFLSRYEEIRKEYDVPPHYIELELTETVVFSNQKLLQGVMKQIHELGYTCSLDDFGSGYSSLNLLRSIPADVIKLDRAFFLGDPSDGDRGQIIVESILELTHRLGIHTVAEGVETWEQVEFLRKGKCDLVQAFLFSKPLPITEFEQLAFPDRL